MKRTFVYVLIVEVIISTSTPIAATRRDNIINSTTIEEVQSNSNSKSNSEEDDWTYSNSKEGALVATETNSFDFNESNPNLFAACDGLGHNSFLAYARRFAKTIHLFYNEDRVRKITLGDSVYGIACNNQYLYALTGQFYVKRITLRVFTNGDASTERTDVVDDLHSYKNGVQPSNIIIKNGVMFVQFSYWISRWPLNDPASDISLVSREGATKLKIPRGEFSEPGNLAINSNNRMFLARNPRGYLYMLSTEGKVKSKLSLGEAIAEAGFNKSASLSGPYLSCLGDKSQSLLMSVSDSHHYKSAVIEIRYNSEKLFDSRTILKMDNVQTGSLVSVLHIFGVAGYYRDSNTAKYKMVVYATNHH